MNRPNIVQFVHMQVNLQRSIHPTMVEIQGKLDRMHLPVLSAKTVRVIKEASDVEILQMSKELEEHKEAIFAAHGSETFLALRKLVNEIKSKRGI